MARARAPIPYVKWKICIPVDLAAAIEELFFDPALKKTRYGSRGDLIVLLLTRYLEEQRAAPRETTTGSDYIWLTPQPETSK